MKRHLEDLMDIIKDLPEEKLISLRKELFQKEKKIHRKYNTGSKNGPVKRFSKVTIHIKCTTCGNSWDVVRDIEESYLASSLNLKGKVEILKVKKGENCEYTNHTNWCGKCLGFITHMDRNELEERYINLLLRSPFKV